MNTPTNNETGSTPALSPLAAALSRDLPASVVVFLVALPLCLGIALASDAPLLSGILSGIIGGILVGMLSGSQTSVAGPAAGLTAVVATQIATLGSFRAVLVATVLAGIIQIVFGVMRAGFVSAFFPSSVIKGLLAAIGLLLILKQVPHLVGHDPDPMGELSFQQPDRENTFSELVLSLFDLHYGAAIVGLLSLALLVSWSRVKLLANSRIPAPLAVVVAGVGASHLLSSLGPAFNIGAEHLVNVPVVEGAQGAMALLEFPDWSHLYNPGVYTAAITLALVASLETLLNLEAVDRIDPQQRHSPPNRELWAQGVGNVASGLLGGLPLTSVIVRSSVNINAGNATRLSAILHGVLLMCSVLLAPQLLNQIPLSCLAAILIVTGLKLASPKLIRQMWSEGKPQFMPFAVTVVAIVTTDLLVGILVGLLIAVGFVLHSNLRRPQRCIMERHAAYDVLRIELGNQVSFLNRAALERTLHEVPRGGHVLVDARSTDYIDPDIMDLLDDFVTVTAPAHGVDISMLGFRDKYPRLEDKILFVDHSSRDLRDALTPERVMQILTEGNRRFRTGERLTRDLVRQVSATAHGQSPMAVVLSCIDSRTPTELIFDLGIGDVFSIRIAGNVAREKVLASMEFASIVAGARLVVVLGHTRCGAVTTAVDLKRKGQRAVDATGCEHLDVLVDEIALSIDGEPPLAADASEQALHEYADRIARKNVRRTMKVIIGQSRCLDRAVREGKVAIVGGVYDVVTGEVDFFATEGSIDDAVLESGDGPDLQPRPVAALPQARLAAEAASLPDRSLTGGESAKPA